MTFAAVDIHISLAAEELFNIGGVSITNAMLLGVIGFVTTLSIGFFVVMTLKLKKTNRLTQVFQWMYEGFVGQINSIITDPKLARKITPLAMTVFIFILINYWLSVLPGIGPITWNNVPLFRGLTADLNFTLGLALITMVTVQLYAIKHLGVLENAKRYFKNPIKDPIGAFEGFLELIGEFSRGVALSLRLFGNAFAGEVLLVIIAALTSYFASVTLPIFMAFEFFIGFIQAYVFFVLTLIFTALAQASHGPTVVHSPAHKPHKAHELE